MGILNNIQAGFHSFVLGVQGVWLALGVVMAFLNCFFGFKLLKVWCTLTGFLIGSIVAFAITEHFSKKPEVSTIVAVVAGAVLGFLAYKLYLAGVFVLCAGLSYLAYTLLVPAQTNEVLHWVLPVVGFVLAVVVGVLAIKFVHPVVVLSTGIGGGLSAAAGLLGIFGFQQGTAATVAGVLLAVLGIFVQLRTTGKPKQHEAVPLVKQ